MGCWDAQINIMVASEMVGVLKDLCIEIGRTRFLFQQLK
jgi:hypothetical protein